MKWFPVMLAVILFSSCAFEQSSNQAEPAPSTEDQSNTTASTMGTTQQPAAGGFGTTGDNTTTKSGRIFNAGEKITFGELELTINGTKPNTIRRGDNPVPEQKAVMVSITAANSGGGAKKLLPIMFQLRGEDGVIYRPSDQGSKLFNLPKFPVFDGVDLQPKGSSIITLVFEIPQQNVFDLLFSWGGNEATVRLGLEW